MNTFQDHDLLIRLDENVRNIANDIKSFNEGLTSQDSRIRIVEDAVTKLSPIPSVSHQQVVADVTTCQEDIVKLKEKNIFLAGGWKGVILFTGSLMGIISFIGVVLGIFQIHFK